MKKLIFISALSVAASVFAIDVDSVLVRQQWPWSTDVKIEFRVQNSDNAPFDVAIKAFDGDTELDAAKFNAAIKEDRFGLQGDGVHVFTMDPKEAFGTSEKMALANFRVQVTAVSDPTAKDILYRIFDLENGGTPLDLSKADIMNHPELYGSYVTEFSKVWAGFSTPLKDVFIWTGVVDYPGAKTTKLIMRRIPAAGKTYKMGSPTTEGYRETQLKETQHDVALTEDFFMGVFEVTQKQWQLIYGKWDPSAPDQLGDNLPVVKQYLGRCRGMHDDVVYDPWDGKKKTVTRWPELPVSYLHYLVDTSFCGKLFSKFKVRFDLPTEAQWEFACRAGTTTAYYSGREDGDAYARVNEIGWQNLNSSGGTVLHEVGSKPCNAYGLYDMIGNVEEYTLDYPIRDLGSAAVTDPKGPKRSDEGVLEPNSDKHVCRGGGYKNGNPNICRSASRRYPYFGNWSTDSEAGFRVICPANANGEWNDYPGDPQ